MSSSTGNMTSLSAKKVEELAKEYKSESTKESILKGYVIYWLYRGQYKLRAEDMEGAEEPNEEPPNPEEPVPTPIARVTPMSNPTTSVPVNPVSTTPAPIKKKKTTKRKISRFRTMYAPEQNYTTSFTKDLPLHKR